MEGFYYEFDTSNNLSPTEFEKSFKEEQIIYATVYNEEINCGPIYSEPPEEVEEIYESIEGQKIHKLNRVDIR